MRSIPAKELSLENFDQYGSFSRLINPDKVSVGPAIRLMGPGFFGKSEAKRS